MYTRILVSGLGSIGSFVVQALTNLKGIDKLVLVDHDQVEQTNLDKSIYPSKYIGVNKALALKDILSNSTDAVLESHPTKFIESKFDMDDIELVIDCRDIISTRTIDSIKLSISDRTLLIDGRKTKYASTIQGSYISAVDIPDLKKVSIIVSVLFTYYSIRELINRNEVIQIPLDLNFYEIQKKLSSTFDKIKDDMIYDSIDNTKISNINDLVRGISSIQENKQVEIELATGSVNEVYLMNKNTFSSTYELIDFISNVIKTSPHESFVINSIGNRITITPESGGA